MRGHVPYHDHLGSGQGTYGAAVQKMANVEISVNLLTTPCHAVAKLANSLGNWFGRKQDKLCEKFHFYVCMYGFVKRDYDGF